MFTVRLWCKERDEVYCRSSMRLSLVNSFPSLWSSLVSHSFNQRLYSDALRHLSLSGFAHLRLQTFLTNPVQLVFGGWSSYWIRDLTAACSTSTETFLYQTKKALRECRPLAKADRPPSFYVRLHNWSRHTSLDAFWTFLHKCQLNISWETDNLLTLQVNLRSLRRCCSALLRDGQQASINLKPLSFRSTIVHRRPQYLCTIINTILMSGTWAMLSSYHCSSQGLYKKIKLFHLCWMF